MWWAAGANSKLQAIAVTEDEVFTSCLDCLELAIGEAGCVSRHGGYLQHRFGILKIAFDSPGYHLGYQSAWNSETLQSPHKRLNPCIHWISGTKKDVRGRL